MNDEPTDMILVKVLKATRRGSEKHSPLYYWMRENFAVLDAEFKLHGPQWPERIKAFADVGLTDYRGNPPTLRRAQQTWYRVLLDMGKRRPRKSQTDKAGITPGSTPQKKERPHSEPWASDDETEITTAGLR